jgi:YfiR/HmsC-like
VTLFLLAREKKKRLPEILNSVKEASALVVGESEGFAERGGGIQFILENNRLRFAVNVDAVGRAHLTVSSKLLALAKIVHDHDQSKGNRTGPSLERYGQPRDTDALHQKEPRTTNQRMNNNPGKLISVDLVTVCGGALSDMKCILERMLASARLLALAEPCPAPVKSLSQQTRHLV